MAGRETQEEAELGYNPETALHCEIVQIGAHEYQLYTQLWWDDDSPMGPSRCKKQYYINVITAIITSIMDSRP